MFLSIVVPVFNVEEYVEKCIRSILDISFMDYEIILVLGKSQDKSNDICIQLEHNFHNIVIIEQNGKGLSNARNCGMLNAKGKYITFIDSDDYIISDKFQFFIDKLIELEKTDKQIDFIVNDFILLNSNNKIAYIQNQIKETDKILLNKNYTEDFILKKGAIWNAWRYIYSNEFLVGHNKTFIENCACEDVDFTIKSFITAKNIYYFHNPYYCYCGNRQESLYNSQKLFNLECLFRIVTNLLYELEKNDIKYESIIKEKLLKEIILYLPSIYDIQKNERYLAIKLYKKHLYLLKNTDCSFIITFYIMVKIIGIKHMARFLYMLKSIRRKIIYK